MKVANGHYWVKLIAVILMTLTLGACGQSNGENPTPTTPDVGRFISASEATLQCQPGVNGRAMVVGPIRADAVGSPGRNYPWGATTVDLQSAGYVEEEFFLCGKPNPLDESYLTRMIVRRPVNPDKASGAVFVEWLNVTNFFDLDLLWAKSSNHLMERGHTFVGVSAQRAGALSKPNGLINWSPNRYKGLKWPGGTEEPLSSQNALLDLSAQKIYTQALQAIRMSGGEGLLGLIKPKWLIATGGSQSAGTLFIHYQLQQALTKLADAYMPLIVSSATLQLQQPSIGFPALAEVIGTPFFLVNSETDRAFIRQPDSSKFRQWEVAGTSHFDSDDFNYFDAILKRDLGLNFAEKDADCDRNPRSKTPLRYVFNSAVDLMLRWLKEGTPPPVAPRFTYGIDGNVMRDERGNILGGIRLPQLEVPIAINTGVNSGSDFCYLFGTHEPFKQEILNSLYSSKASYLDKFTQASRSATNAGFLTSRDAEEGLKSASQIEILR